MDLRSLYYKRYTGIVAAEDYISWAIGNLHWESREVKKLAGMHGKDGLNLFEIEAMFESARQEIGEEVPSEMDCVRHYVQGLHALLLRPGADSLSIVQEIYSKAAAYGLEDRQTEWQELSDAIDDFEYGDNQPGYTSWHLEKATLAKARKLWHTHFQPLDISVFKGQKVVSLEVDQQLTLEFERGFLSIECPWRIRNTEIVLLGETDVRSNQRQWKDMKDLLVGKTIEDILFLDHCPLLIVQLDGLFLDLFHASAFFDGWTMGNEDDFYLFSMHGGSLA